MSKLKFSITGLFFLATFLISYAHEFEVDGIYYNRNADKKSVTVTYRGNYCDEYSNEYSGNVVIPSTVTYLVNTYYVTSIGERAFMGCIGLKSITIPNSVTSIGERAFEYCSGLTSITIPNSVTSIRRYAFAGCSGLTSVTIGNSVTSIGDSAFSNCSDLTSITIPNSVTSIGEYAFSGCSGLTSVTIPNSVTSIGYGAFYGCSGLTSVIFNAENCNDLPSQVWYYCDNLTSFTIGDKVQRIPAKLCYVLSKLTSITIPNSVTSIGNEAFYYCRRLTSITIPNSVTSIGKSAFWSCIGLKSITIPNSVTSIGESAFENCSGLNLIRCDAVTPPSLGYNVFYNVNKSTCKLVVPDQSISLYKSAMQWRNFLNISDAEMVTVDESGISVENGTIENRSNQQIDVYSISGAKAYSGNDAEIILPSGIYVVKAGEKIIKIAL